MTPEEQAANRTTFEYNAGALQQVYGSMRHAIALDIEQAAALEAIRHEAWRQQERSELDNVNFIRDSTRLLPQPHERGDDYFIIKRSADYVAVHGLIKHTVSLQTPFSADTLDDYEETRLRLAAYIVGAKPREGIIVSSGTDVMRLTDRRARKLAKQYSGVLQEPDIDYISSFYQSEESLFTPARRLAADQNTKVLRLSNEDMRGYGVFNHLMHLAALFSMQQEWGRVLTKYTSEAPQDAVEQSKALLETRYGKQPALVPEDPVDITPPAELYGGAGVSLMAED